ncbi:hypothetical protein ACCC92_04230 [Mucilaginibacter sp. Mucisp84]|uniref:GH39 family glycosyl hydrolase n=1 Tax=Mucilaginibacter sp. Mucisp84 TaxID=3243058 RepID=UPI0039A46509
MMKGKRLKVTGDQMYSLKTVADSSIRGNNTDIGALAAADKKEMTVLLWNYHDDDLHDAGKTVKIRIENLPPTFVKLTQYRIDDEHSNAYEVWKKMGSPQKPTAAQIKELEKAGQLQQFGKQVTLQAKSGLAGATVLLPRQGVALLKLSW